MAWFWESENHSRRVACENALGVTWDALNNPEMPQRVGPYLLNLAKLALQFATIPNIRNGNELKIPSESDENAFPIWIANPNEKFFYNGGRKPYQLDRITGWLALHGTEYSPRANQYIQNTLRSDVAKTEISITPDAQAISNSNADYINIGKTGLSFAAGGAMLIRPFDRTSPLDIADVANSVAHEAVHIGESYDTPVLKGTSESQVIISELMAYPMGIHVPEVLGQEPSRKSIAIEALRSRFNGPLVDNLNAFDLTDEFVQIVEPVIHTPEQVAA